MPSLVKIKPCGSAIKYENMNRIQKGNQTVEKRKQLQVARKPNFS